MYVFLRDYEVGRPSSAGAAVRRGKTVGLTAWKRKDKKKIKEVEGLLQCFSILLLSRRNSARTMGLF